MLHEAPHRGDLARAGCVGGVYQSCLIIKDDLKNFLDEKYQEYNNVKFIEDDPIQIPHLFTNHKDIEIAGFLTSIISWGNRKSIIMIRMQ